MRLAIISDIHSNLYALDSVLEDIDSRNIDTIICGGDLVDYLPFPNQVIERIRDRKILTIKGNHDQYAAEFKKPTQEEFEALTPEEIQQSASVRYTSYILDDENRAYLSKLPEEIVLKIGEYSVLLVHGSPRRIDEYMPNDLEKLPEIVETVDHQVVISGHTHKPYHIQYKGKHIINSGSVGKPRHGNHHSTYSIVELTNESVTSEIVEVPYDLEAMIKAIENHPHISNKLIKMLTEGK